MENRSDNVAPAGNLIRCGYDDVLADPKVAKRPAHLYGGPAFVRHMIHHHEKVYITTLNGGPARPGAEEYDAGRLEPSHDAVHHDGND